MSTPDLDSLMAGRLGRGYARREFPPEVSAARGVEQRRRSSAAQNMALTALSRLHRDDFRSLYRQAVAKINAERGPLPGDEA
jgi:hypothetical protein